MSKSSIGAFLSVLRKAKGMTQDEVAEQLGVSPKSVSSWENDRTFPDILLLPAIADLYGVSVEELIRGERNSREETDEKTQRINDAAMKKIRKNKLAQFQRTRDIWTAVAVVGFCFASVGLMIKFVWALVLAILGTCAFFIGIGFLWYQTKKYLSSEGIVFPEDITEENRQFYLSVMHGTIIRVIVCILPLEFIGMIILLNGLAGTVESALGLSLLGIPLCAIVALIIRQRYLISQYGTEEQQRHKKSNLRLFVLLTAAFAVIVTAADFLMINVFFGLSHDYVKSNGEMVYDSKEEFIRHLETLYVRDDVVSIENRKILIAKSSSFSLQLNEIKNDIKAMRENGYPDDVIVERFYDVGEGIVLEYSYIRPDDTEYLCVFFKDPAEDGDGALIYFQNGRIVTLHNEDGTTELVLDLFHHYVMPSPSEYTVESAEHPDSVYYYAADAAFLRRYDAEVYEYRDGKYGVNIHSVYMVQKSELYLISFFFALALETVLYCVLRKKYRFVPVEKTIG